MPHQDCSITILDIHAEDNGAWICHVKKIIRSDLFAEAFVNVDVATPYGLSLDIPSRLTFAPLKDIPRTVSVEDSDETEGVIVETGVKNHYASCSASSMDNLGGGIDPELTWFVNGRQLKNMNSEMLEKLVSTLRC